MAPVGSSPTVSLKPLLEGPQRALWQAAVALLEALRHDGHQAFVVGGAVRDLLLGKPPKEFDLATSAGPDEVIASARRRRWQVIPVGKSFGVIRVRFDDHEFEVATFRSEGAYQDARHPDAADLRFETSLEEDVQRRDFTINGLALDPMADPPEVLDFVGGRADLEEGIIRAIGDPVKRFTEDALRPLRALRFSAVLGLQIDPATREAMGALAPTLARVSVERIHHELARAVGQGDPLRTMDLLVQTGMLEVIFPDFSRPRPEGTDRSLATLAGGLQRGDGLELLLVVLVLARRLCSKAASSDALERYCLHLKTSREETQRALETLDTILVLKDLPPDCRPGLRRRLFRRPMAGAALRMLEALAQVLGGTYPSRARQLRQRFEAEAPSALAIQPLLRGGDLIAAGLKPGPRFAELLDELELLQLEGRLSNRQEALEALEQLLAPHRGA